MFSLLNLVVCLSLSSAATELAKVGNSVITLEDFNKKYAEVNRAANPPTKKELLEDLIRYEMGVQEARKKKLEEDPLTKERFKQEIYKVLLEKELGPQIAKIKPASEDELKRAYNQSPHVRFSHILIAYKENATPEQVAAAKKRATEIYEEEVKGSKRDFKELVKLYSDDTLTKTNGGDVGWQSRVTILPSYYDAVAKMRVGEVKGLIEAPFGFHIVKLVDRRKFEDLDSEGRRQLELTVFQQKQKKFFDEYFTSLKKSYPVTSNPKLLD